MRLLILIFLFTPIISAAQEKPCFKNDTLYTSCGYKIYRGLILDFGKGNRGVEFLYVNIKNKVPNVRLMNHSVLVKKLKDFGISVLGNGYITIKGNLIINGSEREEIIFHMAFDLAIENLLGIPSEVIVPDEYKEKCKINAKKDMERLTKLFYYGTITLEQLEFQRKKILKQ